MGKFGSMLMDKTINKNQFGSAILQAKSRKTIPRYRANQLTFSVQLDEKVHHGLFPTQDLIAGNIPPKVHILGSFIQITTYNEEN